MARTGLTWTLKLNDAMSGAAKKIAASLDKVQGELEALDKAKVDGPAQSVKKLQDRLESQQQKRVERESDRAQKSSKRIAEQIGSVEEKAAERSATVRERLESKAVKARARVNNQAAGQISRGETKLAEMRARYDAMAKKDGARGVKLKQKIAAQEQIVGELRQKTKERAESEYRRFMDEASKYEDRQSKAAARTRARLEKQEAQRAERFAERSAKQAKKSQERIVKVTTIETERAEKQVARKREQLTKRRDKLIERSEKDSARRAARARQGRVDAFKGAAGLYATGLVMLVGASLALGAAIAPRIIELQAFKQATKFAFGQLLKSSAEADRAWSKAESIAIETGMSIQEIAGSMNALLAQGMGIGEVEELTKRFADLKALNPAANIDGIARALMQIKATGKLQGDELMQLNEAGLASDKVYAQLEKRFGKTRDEILKMQAAGKISSQDAIEAIKAALRETTGKEAGAVAAEMAQKTLGGAIGRLMVSLEKLAMADNPAFAQIAKFINQMSDAITSGKLQPMIDAISKGLSDMAVALGKTGDTGGIQAVADAITGFFLVINKTIDAIRWFSENIVGMRYTIGLALWPFLALKSTIEGISSAFQWISDAISGFEARVNSTSATVTAAKGNITGAFDGLLKLDGIFSSAGSNMGAALIQGLVSAIAGGGGLVSGAIGSMIGDAVKQLGLGGEGGGGGGAGGGGLFGAAPGGPGDAMMMGNMAGMEVRNTSNTTKQFAPNVTVNVSGGASNTGGIVGAIADTLKSLNNSFA